MRVLLAAVFLACAANAAAADVALADVCAGYAVQQTGQDTRITCPGQSVPYMTLARCTNPRVRHRIYLDLSAGEDANLHAWVLYYAANPAQAGSPTKLVFDERTAARLALVSAQYKSTRSIVIECTWAP